MSRNCNAVSCLHSVPPGDRDRSDQDAMQGSSEKKITKENVRAYWYSTYNIVLFAPLLADAEVDKV